jgi:hypothetical protein
MIIVRLAIREWGVRDGVVLLLTHLLGASAILNARAVNKKLAFERG